MKVTTVRPGDPGYHGDGTSNGHEVEEDPETVTLDQNLYQTVQELLSAIGELPGVYERIEAFLYGRGFDNPREALEELRKAVF